MTKLGTNDEPTQKESQIMTLATKSHRNGQQDGTKIEKEMPNNDTKANESRPTTKKE
ncbi:23833_t:CDS:2, partial [Gigaspora rosea]